MIEPATLDHVTEVPAEPAADFREFYEAQHERLGRALYLLTRSSHEAEELAQEALVRVYERWDRVRTMDSPVGYLFRTAMNLNRNRLRRLGVAARRLIGPTPQPSELDAIETRDDLFIILDELPIGQRQAVVLIDWLGMDAEEAGRVLGLKAVSVRVRLSRAHAALREALEANDD